MKVVIASDSYKGCLSSAQVATAVERAILARYPHARVVKVCVADGGEGTVDALVDSLGGQIVGARVSDPLGRPVDARYGIAGNLAIIEVAAACGLALLSQGERNPLSASTRGVGELLLDALNRGCRRFLIGLGGSATNDGGKGMTDVLAENGILKVEKYASGIEGVEFTVACDVDTPFIGPLGASRVFAPQKGASPKDVEVLEERMTEYALKILETTGVDVRDMPGAGAAGGLGGSFRAFLGAKLCPGVDIVLDAVNFDALIEGADLVITGEGRSDYQTPKGKTPSGVLARAKKQGIPVALVSGSVESCPELIAMGFSSIDAVTPRGMPLEEALKSAIATQNIYNTVTNIIEVSQNSKTSDCQTEQKRARNESPRIRLVTTQLNCVIY